MKEKNATPKHHLLNVLTSAPSILLLITFFILLVIALWNDHRISTQAKLQGDVNNRDIQKIVTPKLMANTISANNIPSAPSIRDIQKIRNSNKDNVVVATTATSFKIIDSKMGGKHTCVCPLSKMIILHKEDCNDKCPHCHKNLMDAVFTANSNFTGAK
ncbi:MAG: hypothetical protein HQK49_04600 [Oligoflexia bacterium]|nr:hypothetical protein [Oligoflexia bacterium]